MLGTYELELYDTILLMTEKERLWGKATLVMSLNVSSKIANL